MSKHGVFGNAVTFPGQYVSAQKFATLAGGYYPPLHGVSLKTSFVQQNFCGGNSVEPPLHGMQKPPPVGGFAKGKGGDM